MPAGDAPGTLGAGPCAPPLPITPGEGDLSEEF